MNSKLVRFIVFILALSLLASAFAACNNDPGDRSSAPESNTSETESAEPVSDEPGGNEELCRVDINGTRFSANAVNEYNSSAQVVLYDRGCKNADGYLYAVTGADPARALLSVKLGYRNGEPEYSFISYNASCGADTQVLIPVNGFVLSVDTSLIEDGFKFNSSSKISVEGWTAPEYERLDLTVVIPEARANTRRVNMNTPASGVFEQGKIYLCGSGVTVPENSVAIELSAPSAGYYKITGVKTAGSAVSSDQAVLFTGEYNAGYAQKYFSSGELRFSDIDKLNDICDSPAVSFAGGDYIVIPQSNVNAETAENGVYLYDIGGNTAVTRGNGFFYNIVVSAGKVAYVSKESENVVIPSSDGYVVTFAGDSRELCSGFSSGEKVDSLLTESYSLPGMFVRIKTYVFEISALNVPLSDSAPCVLYNSYYGDTTNTPSGDCAEVVIADGKVSSISKDGNSSIPENGYVLAVKKGSTNYSTAANRSQAGDSALISLGGNMYSYSTFRYNNTNVTRQTDFIVVYNDKFGKSTLTNEYGYEFAVDKNGSVRESSYAGNLAIPEGGYVISAHGANIATLEKAYSYGAQAEIDKNNRIIVIKSTPESLFYDAEYRYNDLIETYNSAKERLLCINYDSLDKRINDLTAIYNSVLSDIENNNSTKVVEGAQIMRSICNSLRFSLYESAPVENRAVWYRCNEKSDEDVTATCELMRQMNVNAVYLETWYDGRFIGYSDNPLIQHCSLNGDYDVLEGFCRIGHQYGIEVHCWVENFFIGSTGKLVEATKEYHLLDDKGKDYQPTMYGPFVFLDPLDERSRKLVLDLYREIITKYDVDGINLDYIRFPGTAEDGGDFGYNEDIMAAFKAETGIETDPHYLKKGTADWLKWSRFREAIINDWVRVVYEMINETRQGVSISCAVGSNYPNTRTDICQDFVNWVDNGYIDEVFSMSYFSNLESPAKAIKTFTKYTKGKCFYTIGLSAFESSPDYILVGQVDMGISGGNGSNLFSWGSLIKHEQNYFDALKESIWSLPAARCDSGSKAVYAYCTRLIDNIAKVYLTLKPDQSDILNKISDKAASIAGDAEKVDFESLKGDARKEYLTKAIGQMNELLEIAQTLTDQQINDKLVNGIQFIIDCLTVTR